MSGIKRVGHLVINVRDQQTSTKFYTEVLGFEVSVNREGFGTFLTCGKIHHDLALFQAPVGALPVTEGQLGLNHFAVQVEDMADLQQAYDEFKVLDVKLDHNTDHGMTSSIYFFDPDGNRIEYFCNNQEDSADGLRLMGDESRKNKELVLN